MCPGTANPGSGEPSYPARRAILATSRTRNALDGVTGALMFAGEDICQILEGPPDAVEQTFGRISRDPRHHDVVVITRSSPTERLFPDWAMAACGDAEADRMAASTILKRCSDGDEAAAQDLVELLRRSVATAALW